jgi:hypothetical protein
LWAGGGILRKWPNIFPPCPAPSPLANSAEMRGLVRACLLQDPAARPDADALVGTLATLAEPDGPRQEGDPAAAAAATAAAAADWPPLAVGGGGAAGGPDAGGPDASGRRSQLWSESNGFVKGKFRTLYGGTPAQARHTRIHARTYCAVPPAAEPAPHPPCSSRSLEPATSLGHWICIVCRSHREPRSPTSPSLASAPFAEALRDSSSTYCSISARNHQPALPSAGRRDRAQERAAPGPRAHANPILRPFPRTRIFSSQERAFYFIPPRCCVGDGLGPRQSSSCAQSLPACRP